ncbi:DsbA family protein [Methyloligella solikamskensis]|uniref:DsbA family protein n=1 Tax=Methyloligella solikamskensis TaxID=1177756 RepID=A0ABW3JD54_9HYPH
MAETPKSHSTGSKGLVIAAAVAVVAIVIAGGVYFLGMGDQTETQAASRADADVPMSELLDGGPLDDVVIGDEDAPVTIIEYASMTCPHCAHFHTETFPKVKEKYIDTGKVKFIFREFPLDILAARASMLARCAGPEKRMALTSALFETQQSWAVRDEPEAMDKLLGIARQAGFSKESFDECMADEELYQNIVKMRARASSEFGVNSTPSFFIDGKKLGREHELEDFDAILEEEHAGADDKTESAPAE